MRRWICLALAVSFLWALPAVNADVNAQGIASGTGIGELGPDFSLPDTNGKQHSLSDYRGKYVVLEWLNHDCPFVRKHYDSGNMQSLQRKYTAQGVVWLSIVSSAPGKQGNFPPERAGELTRDKGAFPTAVLLDESGKVGRAYGSKTTPHMHILDPDGIRIYNGAIDDQPHGEIGPDTRNWVAQALDQVLDGRKVSTPATQPYGCSVKY
ncbi:MAG: thioredoxin family protein [Candidatus Omnitrophica bacterium]|nr:thioredoxin family protein [Candidatus Omnitrophota bacterium]